MWTILALLLKPLGRWKVVIAYEGSSPGVDYRNSPMRLSIRKAMVKSADACITNSQAGKAYLVELLDAVENEVFVHPYEVPAADSLETQTSDVESASTPSQGPTFLFVGGIIPRKGLHLLLEACAALNRQGNSDFTLQVVGDGAQQAELEDYCQKNDLTDRVKWVGRVDYASLGDYFRRADVFVLPTLEDTWGMVVLEAMVLGKPILCSKWAGAAELIQAGENGYCFDPNDAEKLAELMRRFIDTPTLAASMGQKSKQLMDQYTPEAAAKFLADVTSFTLRS